MNECVEAKSPFVLYKDKCLSICPKGWFNQNNECKECDAGCEDCKTSGQCTQCKNGFYLYDGKCNTDCPKGLWPDCDNHKCQKCLEICDSCSSATDICKCSTNFFENEDSRCVTASNCSVGTYADSTSKLCKRCSIEFCSRCTDKVTCTECIRGFQLSNNECIEAKNPLQLFRNRIFTSRTFLEERNLEVFSFNKDIKGGFVGTDVISFTFWFRWLKQLLTKDFETIIFETISAVSPPIQSLQFIVTGSLDPKLVPKCGVRITSSSGKTVLYTIPCTFKDVTEWTFFSVILSKDPRSDTGKIEIKVLDNKTNTLNNFSNDLLIKSAFITTDTEIRFNGLERGNAYQIYS